MTAAQHELTEEWLRRVVDCHLARNAVVGAYHTLSYCPLAVPRAKATVRSVGNGFAVDITMDDQKSLKEVIARAQALTRKAPPGASK